MDMDEYLRRNLLQAGAAGADAGIDKVLTRLRSTRFAPQWLLEELDAVKERVEPLPHELAKWRDSMKEVE